MRHLLVFASCLPLFSIVYDHQQGLGQTVSKYLYFYFYIYDRYRMSGSDEEGDYTLDIDQVTLEDDARFQCQVSIYCYLSLVTSYLSIVCISSYNIYAGWRGPRRGPGEVPVRGADGDGAARGSRHPRRGRRGQDPGGQGPQPRVRVQGGQARRRGTQHYLWVSSVHANERMHGLLKTSLAK